MYDCLEELSKVETLVEERLKELEEANKKVENLSNWLEAMGVSKGDVEAIAQGKIPSNIKITVNLP